MSATLGSRLDGETLALDAATVTLPPVVAQAVAAIALGLLGASGIMKLVDPEPTTGAMNVAHLPSSNTLSRLLGLVEIGVAIVALAIAGPSVLLGAGLYAAFAVFTVVAIVSGIPLQSCGCFGKEDTPPTAIHVTFNGFATIALLWVFFSGRGAIDWALPTLELVLYLGFTVIGVYTAYLLMTRLPQALALTSSR
ncbi:MAG TPA: MauE/DoxX family redox-associated membrane protein [Acidimicrobiia bacterium]